MNISPLALTFLGVLAPQGAQLASSGQEVTPRVETFGQATLGSLGLPRLGMSGAPAVGRPFALRVENARPSSVGCLLVGLDDVPVFLPPFGGVLHPSPLVDASCFDLDARGRSRALLARTPVNPSAVGRFLVAQAVVADPEAQGGFAFTRAVRVRFGTAAAEAPLDSPLLTERPGSITASDFNGDGNDDMALLDLVPFGSSTRLRIYFGQSDGTFLQSSTKFISGGVLALRNGDLDGDGDVDLVGGNDSTGRLNAFLNKGNGRFPDRRNSAFGARVRDLELADLDADGVLDVALADYFGSQVHVMLGQGNGRFVLDATYPTGVGLNNRAYDVLAEDFDDDGSLDLVAGLEGSKVRYFAGLGGGAFEPGVNFTVASPHAAGLVAGDFDVDGLLDVAIHSGPVSGGTNKTTLSLLPGNGDGTFAAGVQLVDVRRPGDFAPGDFDGDGNDDFALTSEDWQLTQVWRGAPGGPVHLSTGPGLDNADSLVTGDFDGDGLVDLALGSITDGTVVLRGRGGGRFGSFEELVTNDFLRGVATGDFDGDQITDVAIVRVPPPRGLLVLRGGDDLRFVELELDPELVSAAGPAFRGVEAADLDLDGDDDLLVWGDGGLLALFADGADFRAGPLLLAGGPPSTLQAGDLDGDALPDLLVVPSGSTGEAQVLLNRERGVFQALPSFSIGVPIRFGRLGDVNSDGRLDAAFGVNGGVEWAAGLGDGGFGAFDSISTPGTTLQLELADLNADGLQDLVLNRIVSSAPGLCVLLATAPGVFGNCVVPSGALPFFGTFGIADLDRDGELDIALGAPGFTRLLLGTGTGSFGFAGDFAVPGGPSRILLRDLDGDLLPDYLTFHVQDGVFVQSNQTLR